MGIQCAAWCSPCARLVYALMFAWVCVSARVGAMHGPWHGENWYLWAAAYVTLRAARTVQCCVAAERGLTSKITIPTRHFSYFN